MTAAQQPRMDVLGQIVEDIVQGQVGYCDYLIPARRRLNEKPSLINKNSLKDLNEFRLIGVSTVHFSTWKHSGGKGFTRDCYRVWLTDEGEAFLRGESEAEKDCTLEGDYPSGMFVCKRHNTRHTQEEVQSRRDVLT